MILLLWCLMMDTPAAPTPNVTGSYQLVEYNRVNHLHITRQNGADLRGWLLQETEENDGITRWYADVLIKLNAEGRFQMTIEYRYGEKSWNTGSLETWSMTQNREERGKLAENGDLKVFPDTWTRQGDPSPEPDDKGLIPIAAN